MTTTANQAPSSPSPLKNLDGTSAKGRKLLRTLLSTLFCSGLTDKDLFQMLRAQVLLPLRGTNPDPCRSGEAPGDGKLLPVLPRDVPQRDMPWAEVLKAPLHRLMCPLHERARAGQSVPCGAMHQAPPLDPEAPGPQMFLAFMQQPGMKPCLLLQAAIDSFLPEFLGLEPGAPWPAGDVDPAQLAARARALLATYDEDEDDDDDEDEDQGDDEADEEDGADPGDRAAAHMHQDWLRFLLATGRLAESELREMADHQIFTLIEGRLPCQDDPQRDQLAISRERPPQVPAARYLCPLQVRALRGDDTVPCCEAGELKPAASLLRRVREGYPQDALKRRRPPQPVYWSHDADKPGGPNDVVRLLDIRPCEALGVVIVKGLLWLVASSTYLLQDDPQEEQPAP